MHKDYLLSVYLFQFVSLFFFISDTKKEDDRHNVPNAGKKTAPSESQLPMVDNKKVPLDLDDGGEISLIYKEILHFVSVKGYSGCLIFFYFFLQTTSIMTLMGMR